MGTSSSLSSSLVSVAWACSWLIGTSSSSLESFAGAGAGASLSASDADAFLLVTRVPPRRPRAIVRVSRAAGKCKQSRSPRGGSKIACATSSDSLAFAGSTEARENALAAAATRPPLLCGGLLLPVLSLLLTKASLRGGAARVQWLS